MVEGLTDVLEPKTVPIPWSMLRVDAPLTAQVSVVLWPAERVVGDAVKLEMEGLLPATMTEMVAEALPAALVAVRV